MIEIYECVDCIHCLSFGGGFRVACGHPLLEADAVYDYEPVGDGNAENCDYFTPGLSKEFSMSAIDKAVDMFGDDVSSLRKWAGREKDGSR